MVVHRWEAKMLTQREQTERNGSSQEPCSLTTTNGNSVLNGKSKTGKPGKNTGSGTMAETHDDSSDSSEDFPGKRRPPSPPNAVMITLRLKFGEKQEKVVVATHHRLRKVLRAFSERHLPPGHSAKFLAAGQVAFLNWADTASQARLKDDHIIKLLDMPAKSPVPEVAAAGASSSAVTPACTSQESSPPGGVAAETKAADEKTVPATGASSSVEGDAGITAAKDVTSEPAAVTGTAGVAKSEAGGGKPIAEAAKSKTLSAVSIGTTEMPKKKLGVDYSKWDKLELSEDEDHPADWTRGVKPSYSKESDRALADDDEDDCECHDTDCCAYECCFNREVRKVLTDAREMSDITLRGKLPLSTPTTPARTCKNLMSCLCDICSGLRLEALTKLLSKKEVILTKGHSRQSITIIHKHILKRYSSMVSLYLRAHGLSGSGSRNNRLVQLEAVQYTKREAIRRKKDSWFDMYAGHNPKGESHGRRCACRACMLAEMCVDLANFIEGKSRVYQVQFFEFALKQITERQSALKQLPESQNESKSGDSVVRTKGIDYSKWEKMSLNSDDSSEEEESGGAAFSSPATYGMLDSFMAFMSGAAPSFNGEMYDPFSVSGTPPFTMEVMKEHLALNGKDAPSKKGGKKKGRKGDDAREKDRRKPEKEKKEKEKEKAKEKEKEEKEKEEKEKVKEMEKEKVKEKEKEKAKEKEKTKEKEQVKAWTPKQCKACLRVESKPKEWMLCSSCCSVHYCSAQCQRKDWKGHKPSCSLMAKQKEASK